MKSAKFMALEIRAPYGIINFYLAGYQSSEHKLLTKYYNKLVDIIPAINLSHFLVSDNTISPLDHEEIIRSLKPREAAELLLRKVSMQLQKGNSGVFNNLLVIMNHRGTAATRAISLEMRDKLLKIKGMDSLVSYS